MTSFQDAVKEFEKASPWLGPEHAPALATLRGLAEELDAKVTAALAATFGLTYRNLARQAPTEADDDELARLLGAATR